MVVILGLIIFGSFFGLIGMVIAIPVMVTVNIIYSGCRVGYMLRASDEYTNARVISFPRLRGNEKAIKKP